MDTNQQKSETRRRMIIMLVCVGILLSSIFISKSIKTYFINKQIAARSTLVAVSTIKASYSMWQPEMRVAGSARAVQGVYVTTQLPGMVQTIYFTPGSTTPANATLVQLNADSDIALLNSLKARADLAVVTYERDKKQLAIHAISQQILDTDLANLKSLRAQVSEQLAIVNKKTISAPFAGRLGIRLINTGQYVNPGDRIVSLQMLNPMYVDFLVPQQTLSHLKMGDIVSITSDGFPGKKLEGTITTIDPALDSATRNVTIEATVPNPQSIVVPGMFVYVDIKTGPAQRFLTVPQTAISFQPYGQIIYTLHEKGKDKNNQPILIAKQSFVITGDARGDQIAVVKGLNENDIVVTSGQLKLKNNSQVTINNSVMPPNNPNPFITDER